jgi:hypothetical protein
MILFTLVVPTGDWNFNSETGEEVLGYILTSGPYFCKLFPVQQRKKWSDAFKVSKFACET